MRRLLLILTLIPLAACTATSSSPKPAPSPEQTPTLMQTPTPTPSRTTAGECSADTVHSGPPPSWADPANPPAGMRWVAGVNGLVVGMLFSDPLKAGPDNKILWIVKPPRDDNPLRIQATPAGGGTTITFPEQPANSEPGEIYPTIDDVPTAGCWSLHLSWGANQDFVAVPFG